MGAQNTDKFILAARRLSGTIDSSGIVNSTVDNFGLGSGAGLPTGTAIEITIDRVDSNGVKTPEKEEVICGVVDGDRVINAVRGVEGTAQSHSAGAVWEIRLTASQWDKMINAILVEHNQNGSHKVDMAAEHNPNGSHKDIVFEGIFEVGDIVSSARSSKTGFLLMDGKTIGNVGSGANFESADYESLFNFIDTELGGAPTAAWGSGGKITLPNTKGKVLVGKDAADSDFDAIGETGGEKEHTLTTDEMPAHAHNIANNWCDNGSYPIANHDVLKNFGTSGTSSVGGGAAHNNLQPYLVVNYFIKY